MPLRAIWLLLGLLCLGSAVPAAERLTAVYAPEVVLDGRLSDPAWAKAPGYPFRPGKPFAWGKDIIRRTGSDRRVAEPGTAKFLWNKEWLYIGVEMTDSDVVGEAEKDQTYLFGEGDTVELFLHPRTQTYYWEIYGAVNEKKTGFFFPGRGRLGLPGSKSYRCPGLTVKAACRGTLNDWRDRDSGWTLEIAVPVKALTEFGAKFDNSEEWSILLVRYNYSRYLPIWEVSVLPQISSDNPHLYEDYADLDLQVPPDK